MPDFERVIDELRVDIASTPERKAFEKGVIEGKDKARREVAIVFATFVLVAFAVWAAYIA